MVSNEHSNPPFRLYMRPLALAVFLVLASCGAPGPASQRPSAQASTASSASLSATAPPSLITSVLPFPGGLTCRLPIAFDASLAKQVGRLDPPLGPGGFIDFLSNAFVADNDSASGYDHQKARWVPASHRAISPDGSRYAYTRIPVATPQSGPPATDVVYIVDVTTGTEQQVATPGPVKVVGWTATGIYVSAIAALSYAPPVGLSVINPETLAFHQIISSGTWRLVGDQFAWSVDRDPADPNPPTELEDPVHQLGNRVERLDVANGAVSPVATMIGARVFLLGLDATQTPWIGIDMPDRYEVRGTPYRKAVFSSGPFRNPGSGPFDPHEALADSTGTWFASSATIYHYGSADTEMHSVAGVGWIGFAALAGPCT
jgi:hypothetical protein